VCVCVLQGKNAKGQNIVTFTLRCSMLEIYNEVITDLLNPVATTLSIREDPEEGTFVEGLKTKIAQNGEYAPSAMGTLNP
jgi:centromeric protein E